VDSVLAGQATAAARDRAGCADDFALSAAVAARTTRVRVGSAVTVLSSDDPAAIELYGTQVIPRVRELLA
jgi:alkanesulfonate monooxygenase SsuD/methylene tetrahydromethanopterin reductase-like flavin-dependent oxidoreductase (luciferase family)